MRSEQPQRIPSCPRCGYDQRGLIAQWEPGACPLRGQCTECGLVFEWREVLSTKIRLEQWCVEYAGTRGRLLLNTPRTLVRSLWPWGFWRKMQLAHVISPQRLVAYVLLLGLLVYLMHAASHLVILAHEVHVARRFGLPPGGPAASLTFLELLSLALAPWSDEPITQWGMTSRDLWRFNGMLVFLAMLMMLIVHWWCAAAYAALPISRRVAKVRWIHILRIAMYGMVIVVPIVAAQLLALTLGRFLSAFGLAFLMFRLAVVAGLMFVPALFMWWSLASGRYLRMHYPWAIGASVTVLAFLMTMNLLVWYAVAR